MDSESQSAASRVLCRSPKTTGKLVTLSSLGALLLSGIVMNAAVDESLRGNPPTDPRLGLPAARKAVLSTAPELIAKVHQLGGKTAVDEFGRVIRVDLARLPIGDSNLAVLAKFGQLQWLNLRGINHFKGTLSNEGLRHIRDLTQLKYLNLSANHRLNDTALLHLKHMKQLETLNLQGTRVGNDGLVHLRNNPALKRLYLPSVTWRRGSNGERVFDVPGGVTAAGLVHLAGSSIEYLNGSFGGTETIKRLGALPNLRNYRADWPTPRDTDLIHIQNWKHMPVLFVGLSDGWGDTSRLPLLKALSNLRVLELGSAYNDNVVPDWSGLRVLGELSNLEGLRLYGVTDAALAELPRMDSLRRLDLSCSKITGSGLGELARHPNLRELSLDRFTVTDAGLANLRHVSQVELLYLDSTPFRDDGFAWITSDPRSLVGAKVTFTNDGLQHVARLPNLRVLSLNNVPVTDAGLSRLKNLQTLESLSLAKTHVTDAGLVYLRGLPRISNLCFDGTKVSYDAATELHRLIPQCRISDNWCCGCMAFSPVGSSD